MFVSLIGNAIFITIVVLIAVRKLITPPSLANPQVVSVSNPVLTPQPISGERHHLSYQQWLDLLGQEAKIAAENPPGELYILLGDSISLWFPAHFLPPGNWLNQGISGETTAGLRLRLDILDQTKPKAIFLMVGINDLLQGVRPKTVLANQKQTIRYLKRVHPNTVIVVQSILPHGAETATWEGRKKLIETPNAEVRKMNQSIKEMAKSEGVVYLDLYSLFANEQGNLRIELSTDGLHLNAEGYKLWRLAMDIGKQLTID